MEATDTTPSNVTALPLPTPPDPRRLPKLYAALAKAQLAISNPEKNASNPGFKRGEGAAAVASKYADLAAVLNAIRGPFADNGLALFHAVKVDPAFAWVEVTCTVTHESGEYIDDTMRLPVLVKTPQGVGSSTTYGRRYTASAMAGIAQEDDDGMGGGPANGPPAGKVPPAPKTQKSKPAGSTPPTEIPEEWKEPLDQLCARIKECSTPQDVDTLAMKEQDFAKGVNSVRAVVAKVFLARREELGAKK